VVTPLGGQERRIAAIAGTPSWSPDGSQILVSSNAASPNIRLFLATADGPPERILERFLEGGFWLSPTWHPDGRITIPGRHKTAGRGIFTFGIGTARG